MTLAITNNPKTIDETPLVSIIALNYNQLKITCELLESLRAVTYPNIEVIIVDNGSDIYPQEIEDRFTEAKLVTTRENFGFAGGNNFGLQFARGDFILFINNDTEVEPGFIEPLVARMLSDLGIGAISPKIHFYHTPGSLQYAGSTAIHPLTLRNKHIGYGEYDTGQYDQARPTSYAHGACMMVPRRVITGVGTMAEQFFLYYEELDWCKRIIQAGYTIWYEPDSLIHHKESVTTGKGSVLKTYYLNRNRILFARRNFTGWQFIVSMFYLAFVSMPKTLVCNLAKPKHLKAYISALVWNLTNKKHSHSNNNLKSKSHEPVELLT